MKTRKHRKWYQLNGMLSSGKWNTVIDTPATIYHITTDGKFHVLATVPYIVICKCPMIAVDKETARLTGNYPLSRLHILVGDWKDAEAMGRHLETLSTPTQKF